MDNPLFCKNRRGAVLVIVLAVMLVLGLLGGSFYGMVASERQEVARRHAKSQAELSAYSALEFALLQMRNTHGPWRSQHLNHQAIASNVHFDLASSQNGAFATLSATGWSTLGHAKVSKNVLALSGFRAKALPSLTLLDPNASISLAGKSVVEGSVALQRGRVERSTHYKMPAASTARFTGELLGENWPLWDSVATFPETTSSWLEDRLGKSKKFCSWDAKDTLRGEIHCGKAVLRGDAFCDSCMLFADTITVSGNASFAQALLGAYHIDLNGQGQADGQFLARDSLEIDLKTPQNGHAVFLVIGRKTGPSNYSGHIVIQKLQGRAMVLFLGENWDASLPGVSVSIKEDASLQGIILAHGTLEMKGAIVGAIVAWNLAFEEGGTLWQGFLKDALVRQDTSTAYMIPDSWFLGGEAVYEIP